MTAEPDDSYVRDALVDHVDEEVVAAQWFRASGGFEGKGIGRVWSKVFKGGGGHPADRLGSMNVLALTPTRLIAFSAKTGWRGLELKDRIAEWPAGEVPYDEHAHRVETQKFTGHQPSYTDTIASDIVTLRIRVPGEERPLEIDLPDDPVTQGLLDALKGRGS